MRASRGVIVVLTLLVAVPAWAQESIPPPLKAAKSAEHGTILTGPNGMTVYTFVADKRDGRSQCNGACARKWPPLTPAAGAPVPAGALSLITRDDGTSQYAWKGKPLYYYADDTKPGETAGHNLGKAWFVVQP
jgi:predicted lipoprotein with Yx(FWY)xxD motif